MGKGEIAHYEQFLLFPQCFQKACFPGVSKGVIVREWVKHFKGSKITKRLTIFYFLTGTVKEEDNVYFPQFRKTSMDVNHLPMHPQMYAQATGYMPKYSTMAASHPNYRNKFSDHAKSGFKYWYREPKPIDCKYTSLVDRITLSV